MKITLPKPTTPEEAIRAICYLRAWTVRKLADEIGADESWLSKARKHNRGSQQLIDRVLEMAPEGVTWVDG